MDSRSHSIDEEMRPNQSRMVTINLRAHRASATLLVLQVKYFL